MDSNDVIVESNTIHNCHHAQIDMHATDEASDGCIVRYNNVYYTAAISDTAHGIYSEGASGKVITNLNIYYNIVNDGSTSGTNTGIQLDAFVSSANIYNNVLYLNQDYSVYINCGTGTVNVKNNIAQNTGGADHRILRIVDKTNKTLTNNCWKHTAGIAFATNGNTYVTLAAYQAGESLDTNSIDDGPLMTDPANDDFTLNPHSPCVNAGTDVSLTEDYLGLKIRHAPDIGAYENQANAIFFAMLKYMRGGL